MKKSVENVSKYARNCVCICVGKSVLVHPHRLTLENLMKSKLYRPLTPTHCCVSGFHFVAPFCKNKQLFFAYRYLF